MSPEGGGGGGGGVRQGGIDLLLLCRDTIQVLSGPPPPSLSLSKSPFPPLKSVFSLISLIWEKQPDSLPQSPGWACLLPQAPKSVFSLIFDFRPNQVHCIPSTTTTVPCKIVVGRGREGGLSCCIGGSRVKWGWLCHPVIVTNTAWMGEGI